MKKNSVLFGFIITLFCNQIFTEEIKPKIKLVYGRWGSLPGEFGLVIDVAPEAQTGPNDFYIDEKGVIYILDNVNERVQVFIPFGNYYHRGWEDKEMYKEALKKGPTRTNIQADGSKVKIYTGLLLKDTFRAPIITKKCKNIYIKEAHEGKVKRVVITIVERIYPNKKKYIEERKKETEDGKTIYSTTITLPSGKKVSFSSEKPYSSLARLEGEDKFGNLYISFSLKPGMYKFVKVSPDGKIIGSILIHSPPHFHSYKSGFARISPRGDLYVMGSDDKGFWIDCYPTELFDKPEGRDFTYIYSEKEKDKNNKDKKFRRFTAQ